MEEGSFPGDAIKARRLYHGVVGVDRSMWPPPVVGDAEENVRPLVSVAGEGEEKEGEKFHVGSTSYVLWSGILA